MFVMLIVSTTVMAGCLEAVESELEDGIDWDTTLSLSRSLNKPEQYNHKCTIDTIMCGATWPNDRVQEAFPEVSEQCLRCGAARDTALHCFWECPANAEITSDAMSTNLHSKP